MINIKNLKPLYITDNNGLKKFVVLPIEDFDELVESIEDLAIIAERKGEPTTSHAEFVEQLKASGIL